MNWKREGKPLAIIIAVFVACYYLPVDWLQRTPRIENALWEALSLARWYAREHVLLCLVPAFFIAGAVGVFVSQTAASAEIPGGREKVFVPGAALRFSVKTAPLAASSQRRVYRPADMPLMVKLPSSIR